MFLNEILLDLINPIAKGYGQVLPLAENLLYYLIGIELVILGIYWALDVGDLVPDAIRKILVIGFFSFVIFQFPYFHRVILESAIYMGLTAGGGGNPMSIAEFVNPSKIFEVGLASGMRILSNIGFLDLYTGNVFISVIIALIIIICYVILAAHILVVFVEFYTLSLLSVLLLPFGVFKPTLFIAEKAFGMLVGFAIKLMVLAMIVSIFTPIISDLDILAAKAPLTATSIRDSTEALVIALLLLMLAWQVPAQAAALLTGGPSLSASSFFGTAAAASVGLALGASAAMGAVSAAAAGAVGATRIASAASSAAKMGSGTSGGGVMSQAVGAAKGVVAGAANALASAVSSNFTQAAAEGRLAGFVNTGGTATTGMQNKVDGGKGGGKGGGAGGGGGSSQPGWAKRAVNAGHLANMAIPSESSPAGHSSAPLRH